MVDLPVGALTEVVGPECSGRTSLALAFIANMTQASKVCAWVDVSDTLHPESAAAMGVELSRLLWVRCGSSPVPSPPAAVRMAENCPRESRGCHQQVVAIPEWRLMAFLLQSAICSALLKSLLAAPKRSTNLDRKVSNRILVLRPQSFPLLLSKQPPGVSPGRAWNRHYGLRIYCCKLVDSAASCSIWAA